MFFFHVHTVHLDDDQSFLPADAQLDSLKNNFKFALKLTLKSSYMFVVLNNFKFALKLTLKSSYMFVVLNNFKFALKLTLKSSYIFVVLNNFKFALKLTLERFYLFRCKTPSPGSTLSELC